MKRILFQVQVYASEKLQESCDRRVADSVLDDENDDFIYGNNKSSY